MIGEKHAVERVERGPLGHRVDRRTDARNSDVFGSRHEIGPVEEQACTHTLGHARTHSGLRAGRAGDGGRRSGLSESDLAPVTVTVSATAPIRISAFTVAVNPDVSSIPSRLVVLKPGSVNVTA
jgi:hypothetical protein